MMAGTSPSGDLMPMRWAASAIFSAPTFTPTWQKTELVEAMVASSRVRMVPSVGPP